MSLDIMAAKNKLTPTRWNL